MDDKVTLKEYIKSLLKEIKTLVDERDRLYQKQFKAQEKAVQAAFLASEKAIEKSETSQEAYNVRSNEFRGQLDDQAKLLMARLEAVGLFKAIDDKINALQKAFDEKLETKQKQIDDLIVSRATLAGKASQAQVLVGYLISAIGTIIAIFALLSRFIK